MIYHLPLRLRKKYIPKSIFQQFLQKIAYRLRQTKTHAIQKQDQTFLLYNFSIGCKEVVYLLNKRVLETFREFFLCGVFLRALIYGNLKKFDITQNKDVYFPGKRFIIFHDFKVCFTDVRSELKRLLVKNMRTQLHGFLELQDAEKFGFFLPQVNKPTSDNVFSFKS